MGFKTYLRRFTINVSEYFFQNGAQKLTEKLVHIIPKQTDLDTHELLLFGCGV